MTDLSWKNVWRSRPQPRNGRTNLPQLIAADGFDAVGGIDEHAWRSYVETFTMRMELSPGDSVFEVGCGCGAFLLPLWEAGYAVAGIDYSPELIETARTVMPTADVDVAEAIDLDMAGRFDVLVSNSVFHYFPDLDYAAEVFARMLAASRRGIAVLDVPDASCQEEAIHARRSRFGKENYHRKYADLRHLYYDRDWFGSLIGDAAVNVELVDQDLPGYFHEPYRFNVFVRSCSAG